MMSASELFSLLFSSKLKPARIDWYEGEACRSKEALIGLALEEVREGAWEVWSWSIEEKEGLKVWVAEGRLGTGGLEVLVLPKVPPSLAPKLL